MTAVAAEEPYKRLDPRAVQPLAPTHAHPRLPNREKRAQQQPSHDAGSGPTSHGDAAARADTPRGADDDADGGAGGDFLAAIFDALGPDYSAASVSISPSAPAPALAEVGELDGARQSAARSTRRTAGRGAGSRRS